MKTILFLLLMVPSLLSAQLLHSRSNCILCPDEDDYVGMWHRREDQEKQMNELIEQERRQADELYQWRLAVEQEKEDRWRDEQDARVERELSRIRPNYRRR